MKLYELNLLVAQKIFGSKAKKIVWQDESFGKYTYETPVNYFSESFYIPSGKPLRTHKIDVVPLPHYCTRDGWMVVEQMIKDDWVFNLQTDKNGTSASFGSIITATPFFHRNTSMAICLAALDALGYDTKKIGDL